MKPLFLLLMLLTTALGQGCSSFKPRMPRPITVPCGVGKDEFIRTATQLLQQSGYQIAEADAAIGKVQGNHVPVYTGLGENLQVNGPYVFEANYAGENIIVNVFVVLREQNGKVKVLRTLDESGNTSENDKRYFVPVLNGLRKLCGK
jgi:uncharacterized lipoprotein